MAADQQRLLPKDTKRPPTILDAYLPPVPLTATFHVSGMTCGACVSGLESQLRAVNGITGVSVVLMTERAQVRWQCKL